MRLLVSLLLGGCALVAGDLTGIWVGQIAVGRNGELQDITFKFTQNGSALGGKLYGDYRSTAIVEGKISEYDQVSFVVITQEQAGNQINDTRLRFTGCIENGVINLTRERESATNAGNAGSVQFQRNRNVRQTFQLRRLL